MNYEKIISAINGHRTIVLLLCQQSLSYGTGTDPILRAVRKRSMNEMEEGSSDYNMILASGDNIDEDFFEWLAGRSDRMPTPEWLEILSGLPWSAIFTSCIDSLIPRVFRNNWREVEPVLDKDHVLHDPRRRSVLHVAYLFGRLANPSGDLRSPRTVQELRRRRTRQAIPLLNRLVDTVTPLGVLLIDGYVPGRDWLNIDDLVGVFQDFQEGQVHWFGWRTDESISIESGIQELIDRGVIMTYEEPLDLALRQMQANGFIELNTPPEGADNEWGITMTDTVIQIPPEIWLRASSSIHILDDGIFEPPETMSEEGLYQQFRSFLGNTEDTTLLLDGVLRGFSAARERETDLYDVIQETFDTPPQDRMPVLLHGQSGTGKSVLLARLACRIRKEKKYPVLFSSQIGRIPSVSDLVEFCKYVENSGAHSTLIIIDANMQMLRYEQLADTLSSRGRKVVIVGSSYAVGSGIDRRFRNSRQLISLLPNLSKTEVTNIQNVIKQYAPELDRRANHFIGRFSSHHLLILLYRLLPVTRVQIRAGLGRESIYAEDEIRQSRKKQAEPVVSSNAIQAAMLKAGVIDEEKLLESVVIEVADEYLDFAGQTIFYVLVPGRLNLDVPIEILMRIIGYDDIETSMKILEKVDLLRWTEDEIGNIYVRPRTSLEARLICQRRLGGSDAEIQILLKLVKNVRISADPRDQEVRFLLNLCYALGPNGLEGMRYAQKYNEVSDALGELMSKLGSSHSGIMLQQASLGREYIRANRTEITKDDAMIRLLKNVAVLQSAMRVSPSDITSKKHLVNLEVELAATYGFLVQESISNELSIENIKDYYYSARHWSQRASAKSLDDYYPHDVSLWNAIDLIKKGHLDPIDFADVEADIHDSIEGVNTARLDSLQYANYMKRCQEAGELLNNTELSDDAFKKLIKMGSAAGVLVRARSMTQNDFRDKPIKGEDRSDAKMVFNYLMKYWDLVKKDPRALRYSLTVWWISKMGKILFQGERQPLPENPKDIEELAKLVDSLAVVEGDNINPRIRYLQAVVRWISEDYQAARELWQLVAEETDFNFSGRIIKHHVMSSTDGTPRRFHGQIQWVGQGRKAGVLVEELRQEIGCFPRDFGLIDVTRGMSVPQFLVSFNFIGPIADSPTRTKIDS